MDESTVTVTVSPKYQVVIPKSTREQLTLRPGQKLRVFVFADRIELVPVVPARKLRGFLAGLDTTLERDQDRL